jgi:transcriptional regulator with XRE-family HTH domain
MPQAPLDAIAFALRRERDRTGLSLSELAKRAGIAKSTLSQLESASGNPSVETLWALSVALDVPFARLVEPVRPKVQLLRKGEGPTVFSERADYVATVLSACPPSAPGVVEHVVLCSGRARLGLTEEPVEVAPGDYIAYPGDLPHVFEALEPGTTAVLVSEHV